MLVERGRRARGAIHFESSSVVSGTLPEIDAGARSCKSAIDNLKIIPEGINSIQFKNGI